ncbi:MAG: carboxypeptidase regulatory-like domain-containing protein [Planctomycetota bacterium]
MASRSDSSPLVLAVVALFLGAVAMVLLFVWEPAGDGPQVIDPLATTPEAEVPRDPGDPELVAAEQREAVAPTPTTDTFTTVLWPLDVVLDLVEDRTLPEVPAGRPLGSGRTARLAGRIADAYGKGVRASVRISDGPNAGRVLECDASGRYGANDLYPGMAIVDVTGPNILGSRREVRLRQDKEELLNISYARPSVVQGQIVDEAGEPIAGAFVRLDGQECTTDETGTFYYIEVAAGLCLLEATKEGFAAKRMVLGVSGGNVVQPGKIKVALGRPATLRLVLAADIGGPEPAEVYLMPARTNFERSYPWHLVNPIRVGGSTPVVIQDLPEGPIHVRAYRTGAIADPAYMQVSLHAGEEEKVSIRLKPAKVVAGNVFGPDGLVAGAHVRLTAADPPNALQRHFVTTDELWLDHVLPPMPAAIQELDADGNGHFRVTSWSDLSPFRLLEVTSPDGKLAARICLGPELDDKEIDIHLEPVVERTSTLVVDLPGRTQALPVTVNVDGLPGEPRVVPASDPLVVEGLKPGVYRMRAVWHGERVANDPALVIDGEAHATFVLPAEAIEGQSEEIWRKLDMPYPRREGAAQ